MHNNCHIICLILDDMFYTGMVISDDDHNNGDLENDIEDGFDEEDVLKACQLIKVRRG